MMSYINGRNAYPSCHPNYSHGPDETWALTTANGREVWIGHGAVSRGVTVPEVAFLAIQDRELVSTLLNADELTALIDQLIAVRAAIIGKRMAAK